MILKILVIDPGKTSGYALFEVSTTGRKPRLRRSGCTLGDAAGNENGFDNIRGFVHSIDASVLLIETQFIHPKRKAKNLMQLLENRFTWEFFARDDDWDVLRVDPAEWQNYWKLKPDLSIESKYRRSRDFKQKIVDKAKKVARRKKIAEDQADAILIGMYWIRTRSKEYLAKSS